MEKRAQNRNAYKEHKEIRYASSYAHFYVAMKEEVEEQIEAAEGLLCRIEVHVQGRF